MDNNLKMYAEARGVKLCEIAKTMGIAKSTLTQRLKRPMTQKEIREFKRTARELHEKKFGRTEGG